LLDIAVLPAEFGFLILYHSAMMSHLFQDTVLALLKKEIYQPITISTDITVEIGKY
jgi:hypothetical protein